MNRFLAVMLLGLALCCGYSASKFREFQVRDHPGVVLEGWEQDTKPDRFEQNECFIRRWKFGSTVVGLILYRPDGSPASEFGWYARHFLTSAETRIIVVNEGHSGALIDRALPFTLSAILTTLALLFLTAGVWLLLRDARRRRFRSQWPTAKPVA